MNKQLNVVEKWHQVEGDDIMTGNETNGGSVGVETGQNKHKQKVRGKEDRYHMLTPFSSTPRPWLLPPLRHLLALSIISS